MKRSRRRALALAICLTVLSACASCSGPVVTAVGNSNDLVIIHAEGQESLAGAAATAMSTAEPWLIDEPLFNPTLATPGEADELRNIRHVLLVGTWDDPEFADFAGRAFTRPDAPSSVSLRMSEDIWSRGQLVGAVIGDSENEVIDFLSEKGAEAAASFARAAVRRLAKRLRSDAEDAGMTAALEERFGWSIAPPTGYDFFTTDAEDGFVLFRRTRPDRSIFVYWEPGGPETVSEEFAVARRTELALRYYDGDEIEERRPLLIESVEFLGRPAVRISGWWGNRELVGGGPFLTYCFHEARQNRVYMIDTSLFAPGFDKMSFMRNLDAIAHTFSTPGSPEL
jgi:hypothetical protein